MRFEVNETAAGVVAPPKDICKVKDCPNHRFISKRPYAFCKKHSALRNRMPRAKFKDLASNNELVIPDEAGKRKGPTSKRKKWRVLKRKLLGK